MASMIFFNVADENFVVCFLVVKELVSHDVTFVNISNIHEWLLGFSSRSLQVIVLLLKNCYPFLRTDVIF